MLEVLTNETYKINYPRSPSLLKPLRVDCHFITYYTAPVFIIQVIHQIMMHGIFGDEFRLINNNELWMDRVFAD